MKVRHVVSLCCTVIALRLAAYPLASGLEPPPPELLRLQGDMHIENRPSQQGQLYEVKTVDPTGAHAAHHPMDFRLPVPERPFLWSSSNSQIECDQLLGNPELTVSEVPDPGNPEENVYYAEYWDVVYNIIYFSTLNYTSEPSSLVMLDGDHNITGSNDPSPTYDGFGQAFYAPTGLVTVTVEYNIAIVDVDAGDTVYGELWTLDVGDEGYLYLRDKIGWWEAIVTQASTWEGWRTTISQSTMDAMSGQLMLLLFTTETDNTSPYEQVYLDDVHLTACRRPPSSTVMLPLVLRAMQSGPTEPVCSPYEPDTRDRRGYVDVAATCHGSFGPADQRDYYTLRLDGASKVDVWLRDLPAGSQWDVLVYEDASGYPLACYAGMPGSSDKRAKCTLDPSRSYFILVNAGGAWTGSPNTYTMEVVSR